MPENYFDERIAATYEAKWPELFEPAVAEPAVSFLAGLAGSGTALELGIGTASDSRGHVSVWQKPPGASVEAGR